MARPSITNGSNAKSGGCLSGWWNARGFHSRRSHRNPQGHRHTKSVQFGGLEWDLGRCFVCANGLVWSCAENAGPRLSARCDHPSQPGLEQLRCPNSCETLLNLSTHGALAAEEIEVPLLGISAGAFARSIRTALPTRYSLPLCRPWAYARNILTWMLFSTQLARVSITILSGRT